MRVQFCIERLDAATNNTHTVGAYLAKTCFLSYKMGLNQIPPYVLNLHDQLTRWAHFSSCWEPEPFMLFIEKRKQRSNSWTKSRQKSTCSFALRILFLQTHTTVSTVHLPYTVKEKEGKPDRKPHPLSYGLRIHTETSSLRTLKIMHRNLNKSVRLWIQLLIISCETKQTLG